jgi:hypothetical protein
MSQLFRDLAVHQTMAVCGCQVASHLQCHPKIYSTAEFGGEVTGQRKGLTCTLASAVTPARPEPSFWKLFGSSSPCHVFRSGASRTHATTPYDGLAVLSIGLSVCLWSGWPGSTPPSFQACAPPTSLGLASQAIATISGPFSHSILRHHHTTLLWGRLSPIKPSGKPGDLGDKASC